MSIAKIISAISAITGLLLLFPAPCGATTTQEVISKVMQAYGGQEAVEQVHSVCATGRIVAFAFNDAQGSYSYCVTNDRKLRVDIDYTEFAEHRVLDGPTAYVQTGGNSTQSLTSGPNYLSVVYQYEQLNLPRTLLENRKKIRYAGREQLAGEAVDVLDLDTGSGLTVKIFVDDASGHIVKTSGIFQFSGSQMILSAEFSDFRSVGQTIFPFRFVNFASGEKIAETSIQSYELNPNLSAETFQSP